jgi:hypothetical protein
MLRLHGCLHAFENHRILKRHDVIEAACSSGYSLKNASTHLVLTFFPLGSVTSSRSGLHASTIAELTRVTSCRFASTGSPWRDDEITDWTHWATEFTIDTYLLGSPLAKKHSCVGNQVRLVNELGDLLDQFFLLSTVRPDGRSTLATGIFVLLPFL